MKNSNINGNGNTTFSIVLFAILLLIIFFCFFTYYQRPAPMEYFNNNGCPLDKNLQDPNFLNQRFFHYNNTNKLVPTYPVHVDRDVVTSALYEGREMDSYFGSAKKKSL